MGIMIYAMFIAIILPPMKKERGVFFTVLLAIVFSLCMEYLPVLNTVSDGFAIILCAVCAALIMAWVRPLPPEEEEHEN